MVMDCRRLLRGRALWIDDCRCSGRLRELLAAFDDSKLRRLKLLTARIRDADGAVEQWMVGVLFRTGARGKKPAIYINNHLQPTCKQT